MDFEVGDIAKVCKVIRRKDGRSVVYPGETVLITNVFQTKTAWILNIQPFHDRNPMIDVVVMKNDLKPCLIPVSS